MLGSITPLGERGRSQRYGLTVAAHLTGAAAGGAGLGGALGWAGSAVAAVASPGVRLTILAAVIAAALAFDAEPFGLRIPTVHRQVNEDWLHRYRGWVYGIGFGVQLGIGFATITATAAVHASFAAALLSASAPAGALVGMTFGVARSAVLLAGAGVRRPDQVPRVDARLRSWDRPSRSLTLAVEAALLVVAAGLALG